MTARLIKPEVAAIVVALLIAFLIVGLQRMQVYAMPVAAIFLLGMAVWIAWQDMDDFSIPDGPLIVIALIGTAVRLAMAMDEEVGRELFLVAIDAAVCGGALLVVREAYFRLRGVDGLGFGDVKLAAAAGALIGTADFAWALLTASVAGLLIVLVAAVLMPKRKIDRLPFGTFLAPVCWVLWMLAR